MVDVAIEATPVKRRRNDDVFSGQILMALNNLIYHLINFVASLAMQAESLSRPKQMQLQIKCLQALNEIAFGADYLENE